MAPRKQKSVEQSVESEPKMSEKTESFVPVSKSEKTNKQTNIRDSQRNAILLGAGLLILGVVMLAGNLFNIRFGQFTWPFIFIVPGVIIFISALDSESPTSEGFAVLGSILSMLGFVFLIQSVLDLWASWAYAWSLVAPTSIGLGQMIYGTRKGREPIVRTGKQLATIGLTIFAIGFIFFELVLNINNIGFPSFGLPSLPMTLILVGIIVLVRALLQKR